MIKNLIYAEISTDTLILKLDAAKAPVLWNHKGMYGLIPFTRIQNAFENWKDLDMSGGENIPTAKFYWKNVILVSPQMANALLGEDKDDKCTYRGKDSTHTSPTSG